MKRVLALFALLALALAAPAGALAKKPDPKKGHKGSPAKVYKGSFRAAGTQADYDGDRKFGKAQLVDGKKNDKLSVHVRKLAPKTTYAYGLYQTAKGKPVCEAGANTGELVTDFVYKPKKTNSAGNFNTKTRSKTFKSDPSAFSYFVLVSTTKPDGSALEAVACAALRYKKAKKPKHGSKRHDARAHDRGSHGHGRDGKGKRPRK
jgi:hypothetical protein